MARDYEKSVQAWEILVELANEKKTMTYGELGEKIGRVPIGVARVLSPIKDYCTRSKLPILPAVIVNKATGRAGARISQDRSPDELLHEVFAYSGWRQLKTPTAEELREAHEWRRRTVG